MPVSRSSSGSSTHSPAEMISIIHQKSSQHAQRRASISHPAGRVSRNFSVPNTFKEPQAPQNLGVRAEQKYIDTITKESFGLKLDLFFEKKRSKELENKLELLSREMDAREKALAEALELIEQLEEQKSS
ncbi:MAG: hypothetical protein Q9174_003632, partial [Haloplaca sp. 1 TL-2023]